MLNFLIGLIVGGVAAYIVAKMKQSSPESQDPKGPFREPTIVRLRIIRDEEGRWLIVDRENNPVTPKLVPGDTVIWQIEGSDAFFQFPTQQLFEQLQKEETWTQELRDGGELVLKVAKDVPPDEYVYAAFSNRTERYAEGASPPKLLIPDY